MPTEPMLSERAANEVLDVKLEAEALVEDFDAVWADRKVTPAEMERLMRRAYRILREVLEAKFWVDQNYNVDAAFETARRGGALNPTPHKRERFRAAGLDVLPEDETQRRPDRGQAIGPQMGLKDGDGKTEPVYHANVRAAS